MKNRFIISFLFSFIMLGALSLQIEEHFSNMTIDDQSIELSDWDDEQETESEEDSEEKTVSQIQDFSLLNNCQIDTKRIDTEPFHNQQVFIKIPSPPPELA